MTYLDSRLTDAEILKACTYAESPHLRVVAQRLRERCESLTQARTCATLALCRIANGRTDSAVEHLKLCIEHLTPKP